MRYFLWFLLYAINSIIALTFIIVLLKNIKVPVWADFLFGAWLLLVFAMNYIKTFRIEDV